MFKTVMAGIFAKLTCLLWCICWICTLFRARAAENLCKRRGTSLAFEFCLLKRKRRALVFEWKYLRSWICCIWCLSLHSSCSEPAHESEVIPGKAYEFTLVPVRQSLNLALPLHHRCFMIIICQWGPRSRYEPESVAGSGNGDSALSGTQELFLRTRPRPWSECGHGCARGCCEDAAKSRDARRRWVLLAVEESPRTWSTNCRCLQCRSASAQLLAAPLLPTTCSSPSCPSARGGKAARKCTGTRAGTRCGTLRLASSSFYDPLIHSLISIWKKSKFFLLLYKLMSMSDEN